VQKPKLQTATAPVPSLPMTAQANYISSYQAQINPSQNQGSPVMTQNPAMRDVQIKITRLITWTLVIDSLSEKLVNQTSEWNCQI
jgi:hypothetical protein